jgi:integrase
LTLEEIGRLLATAESGGKRHGLPGHGRTLLYRLALSTGLRWNECRTLVWRNFDFEGTPPPSP